MVLTTAATAHFANGGCCVPLRICVDKLVTASERCWCAFKLGLLCIYDIMLQAESALFCPHVVAFCPHTIVTKWM